MPKIFSFSECNPIDIKKLRSIIQDPNSDTRLKLRAQSIIMTLEGKNGKEIAKELNVRENSVSTWRRSFDRFGVNGLYDKENPGRRGKNKPNPRKQVIETLKKTPPDGSEWTTESLSKVVGTSVDTVRRALRDHYIKVGSSSSWQIKADLGGMAKVIGIVGVYLSSTESAIILSVSSDPVIYRLSGNILTHSKSLSGNYHILLEKNGEVFSLENAICTALNNQALLKRPSNSSLNVFLNTVYSSIAILNDSILYVLHLGNAVEKENLHINKECVTIFDTSDSQEQWLWKIRFTTSLLISSESGMDAVDGLQLAIQNYLEKKNSLIEPFQWVINPNVILSAG